MTDFGGQTFGLSELEVQPFKSILAFEHSDLQDSADIAEFLANFLRRIVKKRDQKLILENNFINKNSDDFYVLQLWFFDIFGLVIQK